MKTLLAINTVTILLLTLNMWHDGKRIDRLQREQKDLRQQSTVNAEMLGEMVVLSHQHQSPYKANDLKHLWTNFTAGTNITIYITNKARPISIPAITNKSLK